MLSLASLRPLAKTIRPLKPESIAPAGSATAPPRMSSAATIFSGCLIQAGVRRPTTARNGAASRFAGRMRRALRICGLAACLAATLPTVAAATVSIGEQRVVVRDAARSVVIERSPLRISFNDRHGRPVLRGLAAGETEPKPLPETEDPEPFGLEHLPDNATYAPLQYEVGEETLAQWNNGLWTGNTLFSRRSGTVHFARSVVAAEPWKRGVRLELSTTEPGRRLIVEVTPDQGRAFRVRVRPDQRQGVITVGDSFVSTEKEDFYGFGGRHGSVDKRGEKLYGDLEQENLGGEETLVPGLSLFDTLVEQGTDFDPDDFTPPDPATLPGGFERYLFPNGANAAYYPQAQFVSSRGYGFLLNQSRRSRWRMANDRADAWQVQASAARLDYTVVIGERVIAADKSPRRAVRGLSAITGRHRVPPRWAQGPTLWRAVQVPVLPGLPAPETAATYRAKIEQDLADIEAHDVEISAYAFEGWALLDDFDYVKSVIRRLRRMGIRTILYHRAYVSNDSLNTQPPGDFDETIAKGLVATTADGDPYIFGSNGGSPATLLDFTDPDTVRWWRARLKLLIDAGSDGFMQDFGEQVQDEMRFDSGAGGRAMHNRYPVIFHRTSREILDQLARRNGVRQPYWFFTRAGYSGRPGSAAYEMGNFPGDGTTDWGGASGLRSLAPDMLNRAVGGAFGFTADIGGYADFLSGATQEEIFVRWSEWAALTPYFRVHNSASQGTRMPWDFGEETLERWTEMAALHQRALPLIRDLWRRGRRNGMPITRPMWLAAPEAPGAATEGQQWLLGRSVLVAPIVEEGATSRQVSFGYGCWRQQGIPGRGPRIEGPTTRVIEAPLGRLPYFFRCGKQPF